jgi:hypothetical protein
MMMRAAAWFCVFMIATAAWCASIIPQTPARGASAGGGGGGATTNTWITAVSGGGGINAPSGEKGLKFTVGSNITVTELGFYNTAGTYASFTVRIRSSTCVQLASAVVAQGTAGTFTWTALGTPLSLTASTVYYITVEYTSAFNETYGNGTYTLGIGTISNSMDASCNDESYPGANGVAANFKYTNP